MCVCVCVCVCQGVLERRSLSRKSFDSFYLKAASLAYGSSWAGDRIRVTAETYAAAMATPDPLTHCARLGIETVSPQ